MSQSQQSQQISQILADLSAQMKGKMSESQQKGVLNAVRLAYEQNPGMLNGGSIGSGTSTTYSEVGGNWTCNKCKLTHKPKVMKCTKCPAPRPY